MDKSFEPQAFEARIYQSWEAQGYFPASGQGTPFCIQLPPPNVTGTLHMGHAFQQTLMDLKVARRISKLGLGAASVLLRRVRGLYKE